MITFKYKDRDIKLFGDENEHVLKMVQKTGTFYEIKMLEDIKSTARSGVCLDVGANYGNHTVFFALLDTFTKVISIEPVPETAAYLAKNIRENRIGSKVKLLEVAVGEKEGTATIELGNEGNKNGMAHITKEVGSIPLRTIDSLLTDEKVTVIKMDIEGYEIHALRGAATTLRRCRPNLYIEAQEEEKRSEIVHFLRDFGYVEIAKFNATPTYKFVYRSRLKRLFGL